MSTENKKIDKKTALQILNSRVQITEAGKWTAKVSNTHVFTPEEGQSRTIVNFAAMTSYHVQEALKALKADEFDKATNFSMSASQLQGQYVPQKGETVDIEVVEHENKAGETILVVSSIIPRVAKAAKKVSFELELAAEPELA